MESDNQVIMPKQDDGSSSSPSTYIADVKAAFSKKNPLDVSQSVDMGQQVVTVTSPAASDSDTDTVSVSLPKMYSSVKFPCVFKFDRTKQTPMLVTIDGQLKSVIGIAPTVNVADYYRDKFIFTPVIHTEIELTISGALSMRRLVEARIRFIVGSTGYETDGVLLSKALTEDITEREGLLSDILTRHISKGQVDEFTVISNGHAISIKNRYLENIIAGDVVMTKGLFFSEHDRFKLSLTTKEGDSDALAVHLTLKLGDDIITKQIIFATSITNGCFVRIENACMYIATNFTDTQYKANITLTPGQTLDVWIYMMNTNTDTGVGTEFLVALVVNGADACIENMSLKVEGIQIGGWKWANIIGSPFKGEIYSIDVYRADDDFESAYLILIAIINPDADNDWIDGIETILENTLLARFIPEGLNLLDKTWHDTLNNLDLTLQGDVRVSDSRRIPQGMQVVSLPINENCTVVIRNETTEQNQEIDYICHENVSGVRLAWLNRFGAIDQYNFEILSEQSTEVEKTAIYTRTGYLTTDISADDYTTVTTRPLPASQLKAMTDILVSDHVFLIESDQFTEVDVISETATTSNYNSLTNLTVKFRPKKRRL